MLRISGNSSEQRLLSWHQKTISIPFSLKISMEPGCFIHHLFGCTQFEGYICAYAWKNLFLNVLWDTLLPSYKYLFKILFPLEISRVFPPIVSNKNKTYISGTKYLNAAFLTFLPVLLFCFGFPLGTVLRLKTYLSDWGWISGRGGELLKHIES